MYESERSAPKLDCKGMEIVRRDTCPAEGKILEKCLKVTISIPRAHMSMYMSMSMSTY